VRTYLSVTAYDAAAEQMVAGTVLDSAETMSDPADLINRAVEALQAAAIDLPAFSTLDRLVGRLRAEVHGRLYSRVSARLMPEDAAVLDGLLAKLPDSATTGFNRLKQAPGPATPKTVTLWTDRLGWMDGLIDPDPLLEGIAHTKLRQFAAEAAALEVGDILDITQPGRRHTLLLALLRQARMRCRDELVEMLLRRVRRTQAAAKEQLDDLHEQHRAIEENLIGIGSMQSCGVVASGRQLRHQLTPVPRARNPLDHASTPQLCMLPPAPASPRVPPPIRRAAGAMPACGVGAAPRRPSASPDHRQAGPPLAW